MPLGRVATSVYDTCGPVPRPRYVPPHDRCSLWAMSEPRAFERILASLYDAMLDDTYWPDTSALIDEACGLTGNALLVGEGPPDDIRVTLRRALLPRAAPGRSGA